MHTGSGQEVCVNRIFVFFCLVLCGIMKSLQLDLAIPGLILFIGLQSLLRTLLAAQCKLLVLIL